MPDMETMESKIRERASQALHDEIDAAAKPLEKLFRIGFGLVIPELKTEAFPAIKALKDAAFNFYREHREKQAIAEFIGKVDSIQSQLDDLRQEVSNAD